MIYLGCSMFKIIKLVKIKVLVKFLNNLVVKFQLFFMTRHDTSTFEMKKFEGGFKFVIFQ